MALIAEAICTCTPRHPQLHWKHILCRLLKSLAALCMCGVFTGVQPAHGPRLHPVLREGHVTASQHECAPVQHLCVCVLWVRVLLALQPCQATAVHGCVCSCTRSFVWCWFCSCVVCVAYPASIVHARMYLCSMTCACCWSLICHICEV